MITNGGGQQQPHWCNTFQDIIGTVGAPDQDTIMGIKTSNAAARKIFLHSDEIIANGK